MIDDEADLYQAVLANSGDAAPRLVYADWLDEKGDPRGEYLRLDWEASNSVDARGVPEPVRDRLADLRRRIRPNWLIDVSVGPSGWVKQVVYDELQSPYDRKAIAAPTWARVERCLDNVGGILF